MERLGIVIASNLPDFIRPPARSAAGKLAALWRREFMSEPGTMERLGIVIASNLPDLIRPPARSAARKLAALWRREFSFSRAGREQQRRLDERP